MINRLKLIPIIFLLLFVGCNSKGNMQEHYENENIKKEAETLNGKLNGAFTEYYESDAIKNVTHYNSGVQHGGSMWYDERGRVIEVQNLAEGKSTSGKATLFYPNGNPKSVMPYVNNKMHVEFVKYYSYGYKKIEGTMRFDKPVGKVTSYDSLGQVINDFFYDSLGVKQNCNHFPAVT